MHLDRAELARPAARGDLDVDRDADAEKAAVVAVASRALLCAQTGVVDGVGGGAQRQRVAARVVGVAGERAERKAIVAEQVALA
jgi:hypothetical protein